MKRRRLIYPVGASKLPLLLDGHGRRLSMVTEHISKAPEARSPGPAREMVGQNVGALFQDTIKLRVLLV